jgi:hypothetical protein
LQFQHSRCGCFCFFDSSEHREGRRQRAKTQAPRPRRSTLHSTRFRPTFPSAVTSAGGFRTPPCLPLSSSAAGIRNPSQRQILASNP